MKDDKYLKEQIAAADAAQTDETEVREVRHTISSEETFTLAKDIYDLRCLIKKIYANRAHIARRLNFASLVFSLIFTAIYVALVLYVGISSTLSQGWQVAVYGILGAYGALVVALGICAVVTRKNSTTKTVSRNNRALKIIRYLVRIASLVMSIFAVVVAFSQNAADSVGLAFRTVALILSIISIIVSLVPLLCGGLGGMARWLISPAKVKIKFSAVALEWYQYASSSSPAFASTQKVEKSKLEDIGRCIDEYINPALGNRKIGSVGVSQIFAAIDNAPQADKATVEGILKNVFDYAVECKYVPENPCKDMRLTGSIEVYTKPKKEPFKVRIGKKIGASIVKQFLGESDDKDK